MDLSQVGMIVCLGIMLWARSKSTSSRAAWGRPVAAIFGLLSLGLALSSVVRFQTKDSNEREDLKNKESFYLHAAYLRTGQYLAKKYPGKNVTVFAYPEMEYNKDRQTIMLTALKDGLGLDATLKDVIYFELPVSEDELDMIPFEEMMITGEEFDKKVQDNFETDVIVSFVPVPIDIANMEYFIQDVASVGPKLCLTFSAVYELSNLLAADRLDSVLCYNPDFRYQLKAPIPESFDAAFAERYLIVTSENVRALAEKYPRLLSEIKVEEKPLYED